MSAENTQAHPRHELDQQLNSPVRLSIMAALAHVDDAEFQTLRDAVEVSDSVLSKQVGVLEAVGYVEVTKGYVGKRPRTWLKVTEQGREALSLHLTALHALIGDL
jgi:DNA-binding MarR family transcriptional regulator